MSRKRYRFEHSLRSYLWYHTSGFTKNDPHNLHHCLGTDGETCFLCHAGTITVTIFPGHLQTMLFMSPLYESLEKPVTLLGTPSQTLYLWLSSWVTNLGLRTTGTIRYNQVVSSRADINLTYLFKLLSVSSRFRNHAGLRASSNTPCVPCMVHRCTDEWSNESATLNPLTVFFGTTCGT